LTIEYILNLKTNKKHGLKEGKGTYLRGLQQKKRVMPVRSFLLTKKTG